MADTAQSSVADQVLEHARDTGHSVLWETEGPLEDARCQHPSCTWPGIQS